MIEWLHGLDEYQRAGGIVVLASLALWVAEPLSRLIWDAPDTRREVDQ